MIEHDGKYTNNNGKEHFSQYKERKQRIQHNCTHNFDPSIIFILGGSEVPLPIYVI